MPQWTAWKRFVREEIEKLPTRRGVYQIAARNKVIIDTGGSDNEDSGVKGRLIERLIHNKCPTGYFFRCRYASLLDSGIELEGKVTRKLITSTGKRPKYNKRTPRTRDWP